MSFISDWAFSSSTGIGVLRLPDGLDGFGFAENGFQRLGDFVRVFKAAIDCVAFFAGPQVFGAGFDGGFHHLVGIAHGRLVGDFADAVEGEGDGTVSPVRRRPW